MRKKTTEAVPLVPPEEFELRGELRRFAIMMGNPNGYRLRSEAEEKADEEERRETLRRRQKKGLTLTVGTVEKIDAAVKVLREKSLGSLASRDKVVDAALALLFDQSKPSVLTWLEHLERQPKRKARAAS
jgi:hypothetical protein